LPISGFFAALQLYLPPRPACRRSRPGLRHAAKARETILRTLPRTLHGQTDHRRRHAPRRSD